MTFGEQFHEKKEEINKKINTRKLMRMLLLGKREFIIYE